jgi:hypothetical protein
MGVKCLTCGENTAENTQFYLDIARADAVRPQYLLWAPGHGTTANGHIRGQCLINATDSARAGGAGTAITNPDYIWNTSWERLAFVNGIHAGNALYVTGDVTVTDDNVAALNALATAGSIRKIDLSDGTHKNCVFSFRRTESLDNFLIESEANGWVKIQNGVPVITRGSFEDAVMQAEIFNLTIAPAPALTLSTSTLSFTANGGSNPVAVTASVSWTAGSDAAWLTLAPTSGSNSGTLTLTATANTANSARTATITVTGGGITRTVAVTQAAAAAPALTVPVDTLSFEAAGGAKTVSVTSHTDWTAGSKATWLTLSPASGANSGTLTVTAAANPGYARTDSAVILAGGLAHRITVTQEAAQQVIVEPEPPVDNHGSIEVSLEIPVNELFSITFTLRLPAGFILDQNATSLVSALLSGYQLIITPAEDGGWRFEIKPQTALRSDGETAYQKVVNIAYTISPESVPAGDYAVKLANVDLTLNSGGTVHRDEITVPVRITSTGNEAVDAATVVYASGLLTVNTPQAEHIHVYAVSGALIFSAQKEAGKTTFNLSGTPAGVYIVTGSSGWSRKVITN